MQYTLSTTWTVILILAALWELTWKGLALWRAGRNNDGAWFVAILVINSVGILPIIYLLSHKPTTQKSHSTTQPSVTDRLPADGVGI